MKNICCEKSAQEKLAELQKEIEKLKRENENLKAENAFLKSVVDSAISLSLC